MTNKNKETPPSPKVKPTFGDTIKQARESMGLSVEQVAHETCISEQNLLDLESNISSNITSHGYLIGYFKTIAKVLNIDSEDLIKNYMATDKALDATETLRPENDLLGGEETSISRVGRVSVILASAFVVIAGAAAYWFFTQDDESSSSEVSETAETEESLEEEAQQPDDEVSQVEDTSTSVSNNNSNSGPPPPPQEDTQNSIEEVSNTLGSQEEFTNEDSQTSFGLNEPGAEGSVPDGFSDPGEPTTTGISNTEDTDLTNETSEDALAESEEVVAEEEEEEIQHILVFEFQDECFVEVTDSNDTRLAFGLQTAGTTLPVDEGDAPYEIQLSDARVVTLTYRGDEVTIDQYVDRRGRAEFTLP